MKNKMNKGFLILGLVFFMLVVNVLAISQPQNTGPFSENKLDAFVIGATDLGSCTNLYAVENSYCSGNIRQYMQCLPMSGGINTFQQRSENCEQYSGTCVTVDGKAECTNQVGSSQASQQTLLFAGIIALASWILAKMTKKKIFYFGFIIAIYMVYTVIKGGV